MKRLALLIVLTVFTQFALSSQSCLPDGITFSTQSEINNFTTNYPNCTEIQGDVTISGDNITNLNGLSVVTSIGGDVLIGDSIYPYISNPLLPSLTGLENMTSIGGDLKIMGNNTLTSLTGLDNVASIEGNLNILGNDSLTSLTGLDDVASIGGDLTIDYNGALTSLTGLENMTSIGGSLNIWGNYTLTSLTGLDNLTSIGGDLSILSDALTSLTGLEGLTSSGGSFYFFGNRLLTNLTGLDNVTSIGGDLIIGEPDGGTALTSLAGLEGLMSIGGDLIISGNSNLTSLTGLDNLTFINGNFELGHYNIYFEGGNPLLTSLEGLGNLTSVGGQLSICGNNSLTSLNGMDNINSIPDLYITDNPSLSNCEAQWLCDYLANPNGSINIYGNSSGCNNPLEVASACGITLPCLPYGNYYFFTQADIDNFQANYPNCTEIEGDIYIRGESITNLNGLNALTSIGGDLHIGNFDTRFHPPVNSLLINLIGLEGLTSIGGNLSFTGNALASLTGLDGLTSIGGNLSIINNNSLISLTGLDNIAASSIENLTIHLNSSLSTCDVHSICNYLANPNGEIDIRKNTIGCYSQSQVEDSCDWAGINELSIFDKLTIFPNPSSTQITVELPSTPQKNALLTIYNINTQQVITRRITEQKTVVDVSGLPKGIYFIKVADDRTMMVGKMVKN